MSLQRFGEKFIDVDGIRSRYFEAGSGERLVFIHGGTCGDSDSAANAEDWDRNFPIMSEHYHCISIDRLGQGYTDNPKTDNDYQMAASVEHAAAMLRKIGKGPYHLVGHSRGGYVACRIAMDHPDLVSSCIIVSSATLAPGLGKGDVAFIGNPHPRFSKESSVYTYEKYSYKTDHMTPDWIDLKYNILITEKNRVAIAKMKDQGLLHSLFQPRLRGDREQLFMRLEHEGILRPTLLIWGFNDPTAEVQLSYGLYEMIAKHQPRSQLSILNETGHHIFRERYDEFNRIVANFVEGVINGD